MANKTLNTILAELRAAQQQQQNGLTPKLTSKLTIGGQLYAIKDPTVDQLATEIENRIQEVVTNLAGIDWEANAKKVSEIIAELENSDNGNAWATAIDKLAGLNINYTQAEANEYNSRLTGAISTETILTVEQALTLNELDGVSSHEYAEGQSPNAVDAVLYNATLEGAYSTSTIKTPQTVKQYVDNAVANVSENASQALTILANTVEEQAQVTATSLNDLSSRINSLDFDEVKTEVKNANNSIVTVEKTQDVTDNHDIYTINLPINYDTATESLTIG